VSESDDARREPPVTSERLWSSLDDSWQEAFRQAWEALRTGNIAVGACATLADGTLVHAARNRVADRDGPAGEVFGSSLAHAEVNVLARLGFRQPRKLVLTTTLEPCVQCSAAIRLGPVAVVRFAGADPLWDGCHDFSPLSRREAARANQLSRGRRVAQRVRAGGTSVGVPPGCLRPVRIPGPRDRRSLARPPRGSWRPAGSARPWPALPRRVLARP
jgi:tRNA(Arg) A34 adenosine deaminase TadA